MALTCRTHPIQNTYRVLRRMRYLLILLLKDTHFIAMLICFQISVSFCDIWLWLCGWVCNKFESTNSKTPLFAHQFNVSKSFDIHKCLGRTHIYGVSFCCSNRFFGKSSSLQSHQLLWHQRQFSFETRLNGGIWRQLIITRVLYHFLLFRTKRLIMN